MTESVTGIDTNVLLRYITRDNQAQYAVASALLKSLTRQNPGFITIVTMAELYWVLKNSYRFDKRSCLNVIRGLLESDAYEFDDGEGVARALELAENGADFADGLIQGTMELYGIPETVTFDQAASRKLGWRLLA